MNIFLRRFSAVILVGGMLALSQAQAQADPFRMGMVDPNRIFKEASSVKATEVKLKQEFSAREKVLIDQGAAARALAEAFERDAPTLSESARATRQRQVAEHDLEFQRARRTMQEDLDARTNEERQRLTLQINQIVKQIAESDKLDLVLQQAVYFNPKSDLTDRVIQILNAQAAK